MEAALSGPGGRVILGEGVLKIGRTPENQLVVDDVKASTRHAELRPGGNSYTVVDLGSTNGTFVNEQRLIPQMARRLQVGDVIRIGDTTYRYETGEAGLPLAVYGRSAGFSKPEYEQAVVVPGNHEEVVPSSLQQEYPEYQEQSPIYVPASPAGNVPPPPPSNPVSQGMVGGQEGFVPAGGYSQVAGVVLRKKRRQRTWVASSVIAVILLLVCGGCGLLLVVNLPSAAKTLDAFCADIKNRDGQEAFNLLSDGLKKQLDNASFVAAINTGKITGCTHSVPSVSGDNADAQVIFSASDGSTQEESSHLIPDSNDNSIWKISSLQASKV